MHIGYLYLVYHGSTGHVLADHVDLQFQDCTTGTVTLNIPMYVYVCVFCIVIYIIMTYKYTIHFHIRC